MNNIILEKHPFTFVKETLSSHLPSDTKLEFSKYKHGGTGITLDREFSTIPFDKFSEQWLFETIDSLTEGQELAMHSRVYIGDEVRHIPLIDFYLKPTVKEIDESLKEIIEKIHGPEYFLFDTGRSYHCYIATLLTPIDWHRFLTELLLLYAEKPVSSIPDQTNLQKLVSTFLTSFKNMNPFNIGTLPLVDSRWVGYSQRHDFSALRWSRNSTKYKEIPTLIFHQSRLG